MQTSENSAKLWLNAKNTSKSRLKNTDSSKCQQLMYNDEGYSFYRSKDPFLSIFQWIFGGQKFSG